MQDMLLKYGMLIVALVVALIMAAFAYSAINSTEAKIEKEQTVSGTNDAVYSKLFSLCEKCLAQRADGECFIVRAKRSEPFAPPTVLPTMNLVAPNGYDGSTYRIESLNDACVVRALE